MEERVDGRHFVQQRQVYWRVLRAQLEVGRLQDGGFYPAENAHGHYGEADELVERAQLGYQFRRAFGRRADVMRFLQSLSIFLTLGTLCSHVETDRIPA